MGIQSFGYSAPIEETPGQRIDPQEVEHLSRRIVQKDITMTQENLEIKEVALAGFKKQVSDISQYLEVNPHLKNDRDWISVQSDIAKAINSVEHNRNELKDLSMKTDEFRNRWVSMIFSGKDIPPGEVQ